jgi:hypothetical protein
MKLSLKDTKIQNLTWCKELLGYLCSHIEESIIPSRLGKKEISHFQKVLCFKQQATLQKQRNPSTSWHFSLVV